MVQGIVAHGQVVGHTMCYINSAINPFIFYTMSKSFKKKVNKQKNLLLHLYPFSDFSYLVLFTLFISLSLSSPNSSSSSSLFPFLLFSYSLTFCSISFLSLLFSSLFFILCLVAFELPAYQALSLFTVEIVKGFIVHFVFKLKRVPKITRFFKLHFFCSHILTPRQYSIHFAIFLGSLQLF
jgi:hypothetical protein